MSKPSRFRARCAFTLIEMIVVISIVILMGTLVIPALAPFLRGNGTARAVNEMSGLIDHARSVAMQMGTWVWVGVADSSTLNNSEQNITLVEVVSRDGSANSDPANLMQLVKPIRLPHVKNYTENFHSSFRFQCSLPSGSGNTPVDFSDFVIGFSPQGEAIIKSGEVPDWIEFEFGPDHSSTAERLSLRVAGASGLVVSGS